MNAVLNTALEIAEGAARIVLRGYRNAPQVTKKGAIDLVTDFDLASEAFIRERLVAAFPGHRIVAEEGAEVGGERFTWYVDPIDGTTNFAHGHPFFCVSLALYENDTPVLGVVAAPALRTSHWALAGAGAFRDGAPCHVSSPDRLDEALGATGFPYDRATSPETNLREHAAFVMRTQDVRRCGSAALDLCLVADGTYDFYWERDLKPWDMGAGLLLVSEAGGRVTDYDGGPVELGRRRVVASNGALHPMVLRVLAEARAADGES